MSFTIQEISLVSIFFWIRFWTLIKDAVLYLALKEVDERTQNVIIVNICVVFIQKFTAWTLSDISTFFFSELSIRQGSLSMFQTSLKTKNETKRISWIVKLMFSTFFAIIATRASKYTPFFCISFNWTNTLIN